MRSLNGSRPDWAAALVLVLASGAHALPSFRLPVATLDEIVVLDYPDIVSRGATPHTDFYTAYARLGYDALGAWYQVFGYTSTSERLAGLLYQVAVVLGVWALSRRFGGRIAIGSGLLAVVLMPSDVTAFAWLGGLALAVWSLVLVRSESSRLAWLVGGLLAGLSVGWRYEMAIVAGLPLVPLIWRHPRAPFVVMGGLAGILPTALHLLEAGGAAWDNVSGRMGVNFQLDASSVPMHVHLGLVVGFAALAGLAARAVVGRTPEDWAWVLLCLGVVPQALQRIDTYHFGFAAVVVYPLALAAGLDLARNRGRRFHRRMVALSLVAFLTVPALFLLTWALGASTRVEAQSITSGSRTISVRADRAEAVEALLDDLHDVVPPGSALFVGTDQMGRTSFSSVPFYYLLSEDYDFHSYYLDLAAGVAERDGSGLSDDIRGADALILSTFDAELGDRLFPFAPKGFTENNRTVREHFEKVSTHGPLMLYVRRS